MSTHGAPRAGDTGGDGPTGRARRPVAPIVLAVAAVLVTGGLTMAARADRSQPSVPTASTMLDSAAAPALPDWFRSAISAPADSTTLPPTSPPAGSAEAESSPTTQAPPASSAMPTTVPPQPTTTLPTITTIAPRLRGVSGELVDAEELAELEAAAAAYIPPPPIPNRQPLRPPTLERDAPDPHLVVDGARFHVFSTNADGFNVPVRTSPDLAVWTDPVDAVPVLPSWAVAGFTWAPSVARIDDRWVMAAAAWSGARNRHCIALFTASTVTGPYSPASGPLVCDVEGAIDPYLFEHAGRSFLLWKQIDSSAGEIFVSELDRASLALSWPTHLLESSEAWEGDVIENPAMIDTGSGLLLAYSANWWTDVRYAIGYAECESPTGPCHKVTTDRAWLATGDGAEGPGGQSFATDASGQLWMGYHGWVGGYWSGGLDGASGGERWFHAEPIAFDGSRPVLVNRPADGRLEHWVRAPGGVIVGGWAGDVDHRRPTTVEVTVDGTTTTTLSTSIPRPDVSSRHPELGVERGFVGHLPVTDGSHEICAVAVDDLGATRTPMGCLIVAIDGAPFGHVTSITSPEAGAVEVTGWAIDPDLEGAAEVRVVIDGVDAGGGPALLGDADVAAAHPAYGPAHGFGLWIPVEPGARDVCVDVLDDVDGPMVRLGCVSVVVASPSTTTVAPTTPTSTTTTTPPTTSTTTSTTTTTTTTTTSTTTTSTTTSSVPPSSPDTSGAP